MFMHVERAERNATSIGNAIDVLQSDPYGMGSIRYAFTHDVGGSETCLAS